MGVASSYMMQSSSGSIPASNTQTPPPTSLLMMGNPNTTTSTGTHAISGDPTWNFPSSSNHITNNNTTNDGRGGLGSSGGGLHFMNFGTTPMSLFHGQQYGGGAVAPTEGHLGMLAALTPFRPIFSVGASDHLLNGLNPHDHHETTSSHHS